MRLVIADDSALIRDGLRHALSAHGLEIAATASDSEQLLRTVEETRPDVALIDIRMPPSHTSEGLAAAAAIRAAMPEVGVLVLSQYVDADYALTLLRDHPARSGYLLKDRITQLDTLLDAIQRVDRGETVVDRELVDLLLNRPATSTRLERLSEREREVLALVAEGLTDRAIAQRLWLTPKTVETHVRHILAKLALPADNQHNRRVLAVLTYLHDTDSHAALPGQDDGSGRSPVRSAE
jgi:DNA-binding NarL/FixJ family response regulator